MHASPRQKEKKAQLTISFYRLFHRQRLLGAKN